MKYRLVYIVSMDVEASSEDEAYYKAVTTADCLLEEGIERLDRWEGIEVKECYCDKEKR